MSEAARETVTIIGEIARKRVNKRAAPQANVEDSFESGGYGSKGSKKPN